MTDFPNKRRHFRFPAFDDSNGVKLPKKNHRNLFQEDESLNRPHYKSYDEEYQAVFSHGVKAPQKAAQTTEPVSERKMTATQTKQTNSVNNAPIESNRLAKIKGEPIKKSIRPIQKREVIKKPTSLTEKAHSIARQEAMISNYQGRSYFVPKYIPASTIKKDETPKISRNDVLASLVDSKKNYLLFEHTEEAAYHHKKQEAASVRKFQLYQDRPIPVTRKQFKQIKHDASSYSDEELDRMLPKTRRELQQAKQQAKTATAYGKKQSAQKQEVKPKNQRLERSLAGLIDDESEKRPNKYFDQ